MSTVFIAGESINLCAPVDEDFPQWAGWFNDAKITRFLDHGKQPNTVEMQKVFYSKALNSGRIILMIKSMSMKLLGVISLSDINYEKSCCQIALVCPEKTKEAPLAPLEAMSLLTEHAFQRLGLERIYAGQSYPGLLSWTKQLEVIGYKTEGLKRNSFKHGMLESDGIMISIVKKNYLEFISQRNGSLWPGEKVAREIIKRLRKEPSIAEDLHDFILQSYKSFDQGIERIEEQIRSDINK